MFTDTIISDMLTAVPGFIRHGIGWREDNWSLVQEDPQVTEDLTTLYFLAQLC